MSEVKKRKFAVFDIDGTLIRWQLYHAIADGLVSAGYADSKSFKDVRESRMQWKARSDSDAFKKYESKLIEAYEKALQTLSPDKLQKVIDVVFEEYKDQVYTYTRDLLKDLKSKGYILLAISGSQAEIVQKIAEYYGFDDFVGTIYEHEGGKFTGVKQIASINKAAVLQQLVDKHQLSSEGSVAVGDSGSDVSMMDMVDKPIAMNPERRLFEHAKENGWKVIIERKNMIYELENDNGKYHLAKTS
jgi:HAD superfamily hydrolase (TIGR01490 family)